MDANGLGLGALFLKAVILGAATMTGIGLVIVVAYGGALLAGKLLAKKDEQETSNG